MTSAIFSPRRALNAQEVGRIVARDQAAPLRRARPAAQPDEPLLLGVEEVALNASAYRAFQYSDDCRPGTLLPRAPAVVSSSDRRYGDCMCLCG